MSVLLKKVSEEKIQSSFKDFLDTLNEKEKIVLTKRVWLDWGQKYTLQSIGESFSPNITRERVRQLEATGIKKLWRIIKSSSLAFIQDFARERLKEAGWLLLKDKLINEIITKLDISPKLNASLISVILQADYDITKSKPRMNTKSYFYLNNIDKTLVEKVYKEWLKILKKKGTVMEQRSLYELVKLKLPEYKTILTINLIDNIFDIYLDIVKWENNYIWLVKWRILNPKTLKDKIIYVMRKQKAPMHFVDISNKIMETLGETVKVNTIHNELIRNNDFILIWKWIYVLKEWWFKPGTVLDVIIEVLKKNWWEPMKTDDIVAKVLKTRVVKETTIYMNLQNKKYIERVWRNYYQLKPWVA